MSVSIHELPGSNPATGWAWVCCVKSPHKCQGVATVAIGQLPCCDHGAVQELRRADDLAEQEHRYAQQQAADELQDEDWLMTGRSFG